ncbi:hypothetical protein M5K25_019218 [Dendrobium thyrsiflorum]|uniref:Uncharacterized protein n=1 Tax=Dendrobium thyrsiflorum TaxID=117978 RepID=A0ABD0UF31_DENTH
MGGMMLNLIKIPWFYHPGLSWSLVYLVRRDSRPNLTEGFLSAIMTAKSPDQRVPVTIFYMWCHLAEKPSNLIDFVYLPTKDQVNMLATRLVESIGGLGYGVDERISIELEVGIGVVVADVLNGTTKSVLQSRVIFGCQSSILTVLARFDCKGLPYRYIQCSYRNDAAHLAIEGRLTI